MIREERQWNRLRFLRGERVGGDEGNIHDPMFAVFADWVQRNGKVPVKSDLLAKTQQGFGRGLTEAERVLVERWLWESVLEGFIEVWKRADQTAYSASTQSLIETLWRSYSSGQARATSRSDWVGVTQLRINQWIQYKKNGSFSKCEGWWADLLEIEADVVLTQLWHEFYTEMGLR